MGSFKLLIKKAPYHFILMLGQQNIYLKQKCNRQFSPLMMKNRSLNMNNLWKQYKDKPLQEVDQKKKFINQMTQWSKRMQRMKNKMILTQIKIDKKKISVKQQKQIPAQQLDLLKLTKSEQLINQKNQNQNDNEQTQSLQKQKISNILNTSLKLVQAICIYGPKQQQLQKLIPQGKTQFPNQLLYINYKSQKDHYQTYSSQFQGQDGVKARKLKNQQITIYTDKTIFRKNVKGLDCSLVLFQPKQHNKQLYKDNPILDKVNSVKLLAGFFIQFADFTFAQYQQQQCSKINNNKSVGAVLKVPNLKQQLQQQGQGSNRESNIPKPKQKHCIKSKYCLCIFTYFPFINLFQQLITSLMNQIKIRRVEAYAKQPNIQKISIKYVISQLDRACSQLTGQLQAIPIEIGSQALLSLGHFKIMFNFYQHKLDDLVYGDWVFDIMKIFDKDVLYDVFVNIMLEESICFVCEDIRKLTHVLFFFISILPKPFSYPHPCICRAFQYEWLESPMIVTIGLNQSSKWVQANAGLYERMIFVDVNGTQAKIRSVRKLKSVKSQKLKKVFHGFYKKMENSSPMSQLFKKKEVKTSRPPTKQQNQTVFATIKNLQNYYKQQIFNHLPNPQIISYIKQLSPELNQCSKISSLLKEVGKYLKQSRNQKQRDCFVEELMQQQIFYVYISKYYQLQ